ncbi:ABC transporter ATP-binding protein [Ligilactobacillus aviarius]|uniref:ABC transporter ATP-binding protein n=1 Tax=Ligilactobacillus aviarius TaxID=1606 RepID=UPI00249F5033|nr:ABC transporter ATP-binding protein [Ligilactobacillus aviarius]
MKLIETQKLTKKFGTFTAVQDLNIKVCSGELTAYLGSNGAGKSTTIAMLIDNLKPTSGKIIYHDNLKIGVVFQNSILDHELTVKQNLQIRAELEGHAVQKYLNEIMRKTGVDRFANQKYGTLSGGMKRKVDIARALLNQPDVLFLDEPTTGLDVTARKEIWQLINELKEKQELAVFLTTHYLEEAENADNVYILNHGRIVEHGSAIELKQKYSQIKLRIKFKNEINQELLSNLILKHDFYEYQCPNAQKAIQFLNQYKDQIEYFEYLPVEMTDVFMKLIKEEA